MTTLTSSQGIMTFGTGHPTVLAAMLINTLKDDELARELAQGKLDRVKILAERQKAEGVGFLDIMIAHQEIDEKEMLPKVCLAAHETAGLPISLDTNNIGALARTLDAFPYKVIINSFNGEDHKIESILPLAKASGSAVIGLCMDKTGIPNTIEERLQIAKKLVNSAQEYGINKDDLVIDPLCLTAAVFPPDAMRVTLELLRLIKQELSVTTFLGIDNAGFGMPQKDLIDIVYLMAAIPAGLDAALLEPPTCSTLGQLGITALFASDFLSGNDPYGMHFLSHIRSHGLQRKQLIN